MAIQLQEKASFCATSVPIDVPIDVPIETAQRRRVTLGDVARRVQVAPMTVSRALNKPHLVSAELRGRIEAAVEELGYIQDWLAGNLATGSSAIIPVLIPTLKHDVFVPVLNALSGPLDAAGYQIMLGTSEYDPQQEQKAVQNLLGWRPAGLVLSGTDHSAKTTQLLKAAGITVIELGDLTAQPIDINIGFDHAQIGQAAAKDLLARGRRNVAYIGSMKRFDQRGLRRIRAFQDTLKAAGVPHTHIIRSEKPSSIALGAELLGKVLARYPQTDALFCAHDDLAAGALFEAQRQGVSVPGQIAILGFNDSSVAAQLNPPLSSVRTPRSEMGRLAAQLLLSRLAGAPPGVGAKQHDLGFEIIHRATT